MKKIIVWVISVHLALIGLLCASRRVTQHNSYQPLSIQTVVLQPQHHPTTQSTPKSSHTPSTAPSKPAKAKKEHTALAKLMRESLQTLDQSTPSKPKKNAPPKKIGKLASEVLTFETNYASELIVYLQELMILPEEGEVKLLLTLKRQGSVESMTIQSASSIKNRTYVEQTLTSLALPPFGKHFKGKERHQFTVTLCSKNRH